MKTTETSDLWWKNAVVYCLDVETFYDSNGDGIGDFAGLAERVHYLADLGVTCIWLMPFYPTPDRDDGYDITDFFGVDSRLGTHGDLVEFLRMAKDQGIRVIADLVVNHTSDQHPWFRSAVESRDSPFRDFYVWRSDPPPDTSAEVTFPDQEDSIWTRSEPTGDWYQHRFYRHQPDLNVANPRVRDEIAKAAGFWLELGMDGFRVDAVPFFLELTGAQSNELPEPHEFLKDLRRFLGRRRPGAILLGEVNLPYEAQLRFLGGEAADELTMLFDFIGMQNLYLALARQEAAPLAAALQGRPETNPDSQWATFVRNHDELTLDKLTESQRQEVFAAFGPEEKMQVYGRGLKRRLPPMLGGDPRRIRMVYSLLFSLPGTPVLFYGEEIGMGEDLAAEGRLAVRTPMQWTDGKNGGFSSAEEANLVARPVQGEYGPDAVNAARARQDPESLLHFLAELIRRYRQCPELGWGSFEVLSQANPSVLAHRCTWGASSMVLVHNFAPSAVPVTLDVTSSRHSASDLDGKTLLDLLGGTGPRISRKGTVNLDLEPYGYRWLRIPDPDDHRLP
ncbi:alpha-glucosidase C-terminal domain-containing protein [Arthrobacter sp. MSA 4-2]|uniref:alpha-amylase family protein n=1 Tax=Arthrobacter sp. MSA 4-2 TaxID=2794349 RepID=UPI0018E6E377|nr:alpha-amylase family protein [Arthrobacter sp. MSA 4-2]MBJ2122652.1 alpha-glucosidase C-terminal domain-containing protein [Arthrobacter sp. MSA 4-2]